MHSRFRHVVALLAFACCALAARAQITFTFTGFVDGDCSMLGYTANAPVTFVLTTGSSFAANSSYFDANHAVWAEETMDDQRLFVSLSGGGLGGTLIQPSADYHDPFSALIVEHVTIDEQTRTFLNIVVSADNSSNIGLTSPSAATIHTFTVTLDLTNVLTVAVPTSYTDPIAFFASHAGTYGEFNSTDITLTDNTASESFPDGIMVEFNVSSMTISAIPEPATYAALLGLAALGAVGVRAASRRKAA